MSTQLTVEHRIGATPKGQSPSSRVVAEITRQFSGGLLSGLAGHLAPALDAVAAWRGLPEGVQVDQVSVRGFRAEIVRDQVDCPALHDGVVLYIHGGNLFGGERAGSGFATHRTIAAQLAQRSGMAVMSVDYRRDAGSAQAVEDCVRAYRWLLSHRISADRIVVVGDSSGAHLGFAMVLKLMLAGVARPAGMVGISGRFDRDLPGEFLGQPGLFALNGPVGMLPPTLLLAAEDDVRHGAMMATAERLARAGVSTKVQVWQGQAHAFVSSFPHLPESQLAISDIARFVLSKMAVAAAERATA